VSADGDLQKAFHVQSLPTTLLLDEGRVVAYRVGIRGARAVVKEADRRLGED
jgi:thioredoxin-like negative regulator of GroEL